MNNKGFTLVELLVVIAVAGLLLTVVLSLLLSGFENFNIGTDRAGIQDDIRLVENIIHNELRNAMCIKIGVDLKDYKDVDGESSWEDCPGDEYTMELVNGAFKYKGRKVTGNVFEDIYFEIINKNIFKLKLTFKNNVRESYEIKMLVNNFELDDSITEKKYLNDHNLIYKYQKGE